MFIGHYGPAVWDAHNADGVKLWHGFLAVQAIDLVFCVLAIMGLEGGTIEGSHPLAFNIPYSHSLVGAFFISAMVALLYRILRPKTGVKGAYIMGGLAFSHWPLDWLVHRPDLPIMIGGSNYQGLGLWDYAWPTYALEVLLLAGMMFWWIKVTTGSRATVIAAAIILLVLAALQFIAITLPTLMVQNGTFDPSALPDPVMSAVQALVVFVITILAIAMLERKRTTKVI